MIKIIKQKYDYKFFVDNYNYRYDSMFRKYYKILENEYRWFIIVTKDINEYSSQVFRSNLSIDIIFSKFKDMNFQKAEIIDNKSMFPGVYKYTYNKILDNEWITGDYMLRNGVSSLRNMTTNKWIYKYWADKKYIYSCRIDDDTCDVYFDGISVSNNKGLVKVEKYIPFSNAKELKFDMGVKDKLEKITKRIQKDNIDGFYDDMIKRIKNNFGVKGV